MKTPDLHSEREIIAAAAAMPPEERAAYLDATCAGRLELRVRVEAWLDAHEPSDFMQTVIDENQLSPEGAGERIGNYKLLEKIGEGGFGVVWVADQERPVRRRVALKIIKLGMDTREVIARFGQERQALAMMDHPHIAKVLDAGATEWGRPYFVMELVRGIKITDYCDQANLPTAERLALFIQVCSAVQHAHQKGIIHRDLKPSNILVTLHDGVPVPKVIDFGVAKATQQQPLTDLTIYTQFQQMIGTPLYMSPEQAEMSGLDIDTRSDIYSLGVLLYELLTGRTPFDPAELMRKGYDEIRRAIREQEPQTPSTFLQTMADATRATVAGHRHSDPAKLTKLVRGDLDWIVMKALEKDRSRRYDTANGLAMDVQRHLHNEPVVARPPSNVYRFQKLVRRNKLAVVAAGVVAAVLVVGAVVSTWQAIRATRAEQAQTRLREEAENARNNEAQLRIQAQAEQKKAITEAARSAQVARFMQGMLNGVGPGVARGRDTTLLREILDQTAARLDELKAQPEVEADLRETLGVVYRDIGLYSNAQVMIEDALRLRQELHGREHAAVASALHNLAEVFRQQRRNAAGEDVYREALAIRRRLFGNENAEVAASLFGLAEVIRRRETAPALSEAEAAHREALAIRRKLLGNEDPTVAGSLTGLGIVLGKEGQRTESVACFRAALDIQRARLGGEHSDVAYTLCNLGFSLGDAEGEAMLREALAMQRKILGDHRDTAYTLNFLGSLLQKQGKAADAEQLHREALAIQRKVLGEHTDIGVSLAYLGQALAAQGRLADAEGFYREALALRRHLIGDQHPYTMGALAELTFLLRREGKFPEAESLYSELLASGSDWALNGLAWNMATSAVEQERDASNAVRFAEKAVVMSHRNNPNFLDTLAAAYAGAGQFEKAISVQQEAITLLKDENLRKDFASRGTLYQSGLPYRNPDSLALKAGELLDAGKFADAEPLALQCLAIREQQIPDDWRTFSAKSLLGASLLGQRKFAAAEPLLLAGYEGLKQREDKIPANGRVNLSKAMQLLVELYESTARPEQAAEWEKKLSGFNPPEAGKKAAAEQP